MIGNSLCIISLGTCKKAKPVKPGNHNLHMQPPTFNCECRKFQAISDWTLGSIQSGHEPYESHTADQDIRFYLHLIRLYI